MIFLKSEREIELMRRAGRVVAEVLDRIRARARPGVTTLELDQLAEEVIRGRGAIPAFKGYAPAGMPPYPATICASVNDVVVHGIPGPRRLKEGDILSVDVGAFLNGYCGDSATTIPIGPISPETERLLRVTEEALHRGIEAARPGARLGDVGHAIESHVVAHGFSVVRDLVGHGVGRAMHEEPQVPNYGHPGTGVRLKPGMTIAIEPMVNAGRSDVRTLDDEWTVATADGTLSAHFEHTIAITQDGPVILTLP